MSALVPLPVLLPILGAGLSLVLGQHPRLQRWVSVVVLSSIVVIAAILMVAADTDGPQVLWIGGWPETLGIVLVADRLATLMLLVSAVVTLAVLGYSIGQGMTEDEEDATLSVYHPTFLVLVAGVANAFLAGDLFNLFVSFEMLLFASYVLLTLGGTATRLRAGTIYVLVNLLSSTLFLISLAVVYAATGTLTLAHLAERIADLPDHVALMIQLLLLTTFAIKAAVFPLSFWLPDSYPTAPAPVTAVFAGLLTKVGIYAILRMQTLLFPESPLTGLLMWAALLTMLVGILGAIAQSDIKRMLSFTLVSHIGYLVLGIALATSAGVAGTVFYVVHHITVQTALFLVVGLVERRAGSTSLMRIGGLARIAPLLAVLFFVPAMNLAGIPPFSGFIGKVGLLQAAQDQGSVLAWVLVVGGVLTSLLTLYAVAKTWAVAFWRTPAEAHEALEEIADRDPGYGSQAFAEHRGHVHTAQGSLSLTAIEEARRLGDDDMPDRDFHQLITDGDDTKHMPRSMVLPTALLVTLSVGLTFLAGPLFAFSDRAADDLLERTPYLSAVLTGDEQ
ncbi:Na+/H+ antiporter subunit D [Nocardioides sp. dk4132]|uniref:Na+/H+ antiporter subunit D n=1 Tax=unclassified Nocardioides TaxID=2615069 RepID=UPI0012965AA3|nr:MULTISPECIES: Na+/H+ antiporter subunit D [unclassified Nocardioides]MQW77494.1 Na+/H+ antiporter subunit D [Nocardioides sp. dk4132]QGA09293.1 Na+/H+ antiporter subunit D [Nocardioides sp. dk884]